MKCLIRFSLVLFALLCALPAHALLPPVTNFAKVTVSTGYNSAATSIVLLSGHGAKLPSTFAFPLVWWNCTDFGAPEDDPFVEIISVTARATDTLTVVRAQEGTAAANHNTGGKTYCMILTLTKGMWDQIRTDIAAAGGGITKVKTGSGSPEGVVIGNRGDIYLRDDGSSSDVIWTKDSGNGTNTGWLVVPNVNWSLPGNIGGVTPNVATFTQLHAFQHFITDSAPTYGANVAINAAAGSLAVIAATNGSAFQIDNPTNLSQGALLIVRVKNTSGGTLGVVTWDTLYKMATFTKPANGFQRSVGFIYDGSVLVEIFCSPEVPN